MRMAASRMRRQERTFELPSSLSSITHIPLCPLFPLPPSPAFPASLCSRFPLFPLQRRRQSITILDDPQRSSTILDDPQRRRISTAILDENGDPQRRGRSSTTAISRCNNEGPLVFVCSSSVHLYLCLYVCVCHFVHVPSVLSIQATVDGIFSLRSRPRRIKTDDETCSSRLQGVAVRWGAGHPGHLLHATRVASHPGGLGGLRQVAPVVSKVGSYY